MRNLANFLLFQAGWFACVLGAAEGRMWLGPAATVLLVALHLRVSVAPGRRRATLGYIVVAGGLGALLDTGQHLTDALRYPTSAEVWTLPIVPPWIASLWVLFALLPAHSLAWLAPRPRLAFVLGAVGGPLSFLTGTSFDVVGPGAVPLWTWGALALEYALVTPLLLRTVPDPGGLRTQDAQLGASPASPAS